MKRRAIVLFVLLLFGSSLAAATFTGKVRADGKPLDGANVLLKDLSGKTLLYQTDTDAEGNFALKAEEGEYLLEIKKYGLTLHRQRVEVKEGKILELDLKLSFLDKALIFTREMSDILWGSWMIVLILGTGILLSLMTGFVQIRRFAKGVKLVVKGAFKKDFEEEEEGDISPFAALMTALAATVGNGNIAGVATAIATGGPGAPFWMWVAGVFGMATKYAEGFLGVKYRVKNELGEMAGGPMYYARYGIKNQTFAKALGAIFAFCGGITALLGTGNMAQSNSMALAFNDQFRVPFWVTGLVVAVLTGIVTIGGIKRIGEVSEKLVPSMIVLYFLGAVIIVIANIERLPEAFKIIFESAFSVKAVGGALIGQGVKEAISIGVRRGVLSNEAGLGSAAIAQSASKSSDPTKNGLIAMMGVFIDTIVVNTLTTLSIVITGMYLKTAFFGAKEALTSTALTAAAFSSVIPKGGIIIALSSFLFGYSTLIGWSYYGEKCWEYIFGTKIIMPYRLIFVILIFIGAVVQGEHLNIIWYLGDSANALMAIPNLIALIALAKVVRDITYKDLYRKP